LKVDWKYKVEMYLRVSRACFVEGMSAREAARVYGLHLYTVRKLLKYSVPGGYRRDRPPDRPSSSHGGSADQSGPLPNDQEARHLRLPVYAFAQQVTGAGAGQVRVHRAQPERHRSRQQRHRQDPYRPWSRSCCMPAWTVRGLHYHCSSGTRTDGGQGRTATPTASSTAAGRIRISRWTRSKLQQTTRPLLLMPSRPLVWVCSAPLVHGSGGSGLGWRG
jgi:hypothetical protein